MPIYNILFKAELQGVEKLEVRKDNQWLLDLACGTETREGVFLDSTEELEVEGSRGTAQLVIKFPGQQKAASISIVPFDAKKKPGIYSPEDSGKFKVIASFDCRGCEIIGYKPTTDFDVISEGGKRFEKEDLSEGDYSEYDEEADAAISVLEIETKVERG